MKKILLFMLSVMIFILSGCENNIDNNIEENNTKVSTTGYVNTTLRFSAVLDGTLNPLVCDTYSVKRFMEYVYEPLFAIDDQFQAVPVLAQDYATDGNSITVKLKNNVVWHDNTVFSADDVVYTVKSIIEGKTSLTRPEFSNVRKIDNNTVIISFKRPVIGAVQTLNFPIVKNNSSLSGGTPMGTGRYRYNGKISVDEYLFCPFASYHGIPATQNIELTGVDSIDKEIQMFRAGETDVLFHDGEELINTANGRTNVIYENGSLMAYIGINHNNPILAGVNTRCAIASAINKSSIVNSFLQTRAISSDYAANPEAWIFHEQKTTSEYNLDRAEEYMKNDGWELRDGCFVRQTGDAIQNAKIRILSGEGEIHRRVADFIASELSSFGIECELNEVSAAEFNEYILSGDFDLFIAESDIGANMDYTKLTASPNVFSYTSQNLDRLTRQYAANPYSSEVYMQCLNEIKSSVAFIPLYFKNGVIFASESFGR